MGLADIIEDKSVRANIIEECIQLIDEQMASKRGISGLALKTAYKVVNGVGPKYVSGAIGRLLPEVFKALDPIWDEGLQAGDPVEYLIQNKSRVADMLLGITDARIQKTSNKVIRSPYNKIRKSVKGDVEEAVPGLARIIETHTRAMQQA